MIKIYALTDMLYRFGFKKEAQSVYGLGNVVQTYEFEIDEVEDGNTFDPGFLGGPMTSEPTNSEVTWVEEEEDPLIVIERQSGELWGNAPLEKEHPIVQRLISGFSLLWNFFLTGEGMVSSKELSKAALIFKYFDNEFKSRMDRPTYIAQSGKAIKPEQALKIISFAMKEFLLRVPKEQLRPRWINEIQEWAFGFYEEYADYYYDNVDSTNRDKEMNILRQRVDKNPTVMDDEDFRRRFDDAQKLWEESEGDRDSESKEVG